MDGKSSIPTMIKRPGIPVRGHVPCDRIASAPTNGLIKPNAVTGLKSQTGNRMALTSFQSVLNSLRNGINTTNRPMKRHASPEFRAPKQQSILAAKKLRRSRSVSDISTIKRNAFFTDDKRRAANKFHMPLALAQKTQPFRVPLALPKAEKAEKPKSATTTVGNKNVPSHKRVVLNSRTTAKKENFGSKKENEDVKPKGAGAAVKRIPAYDFKARYHDLLEKHKVLKEQHEHLKEKFDEYESLPEQYEECREQLCNLQTNYELVQKELVTLKQQNEVDQEKINSLHYELQTKIEECRVVTEARNCITEQYTAVNTENIQLKSNNANLETQMQSQQEIIEQLQMELQAAGEQLFRANIERKELHNAVMDLRGNIRVFCRIRPPLNGEENRNLCSWQHNDETSLEIGELRI